MNTKEKILYESLKLFSTKGYEATGVEEIAKAKEKEVMTI